MWCSSSCRRSRAGSRRSRTRRLNWSACGRTPAASIWMISMPCGSASIAPGKRIKLLYVIPNFQNPTGSLLALDRRARLLEWAERRDLLIVEDDPYGSLYFDDVASERETRPLRADDANGRVLYLSTVSKTLAPGFRVGWMVAPPMLIERFDTAKQSSDLTSGILDQCIVHRSAAPRRHRSAGAAAPRVVPDETGCHGSGDSRAARRPADVVAAQGRLLHLGDAARRSARRRMSSSARWSTAWCSSLAAHSTWTAAATTPFACPFPRPHPIAFAKAFVVWRRHCSPRLDAAQGAQLRRGALASRAAGSLPSAARGRAEPRAVRPPFL